MSFYPVLHQRFIWEAPLPLRLGRGLLGHAQRLVRAQQAGLIALRLAASRRFVALAVLFGDQALAVCLNVGHQQIHVILAVALRPAIALLGLVLEDDDLLAAP